MRSLNLIRVTVIAALVPLAMAGSETKAPIAKLTVQQIVDKNVTARGGLSAWRAVNTLEMKGKMDAGGNQRSTIPVPNESEAAKVVPKRPSEQAQLPFLMDLQRGHKVRVEIEFHGQTAVQVYNGSQGWKLRPFLNRHQVENFTADELKAASKDSDLDGLLIDYSSKGAKVDLEGVEVVDGRNCYKLKVTDKSGNVRHDWVDAETFLETKVEGNPRRLDGKEHPVATYFSDYRPVNGIVMPYVLETRVEGVKDTEKILIESIVANPKLDDSRFAMPR
ncbi:MAG TPA: hypothetical protein VKV39_08175 [Candidatus Sulfotelmatobacter sp.]|nr:hypothetical protein [Candidatus Sulfotelmatobacter sp.]